MVAGSNPATPTSNSYLNPPKSVNKNTDKTVNNDRFTATFLNQLSSAQAKLGLSDRALAKKLGISNAYLSYIKRGERKVTPAVFQKVSNFLSDFSSRSQKNSNILGSSCTYIEGMRITGKHNIKHFAEDFLIAKQVEGKSPATLAFYRQNLERFLWWIQQNGVCQNIRRIEARQLRSFLAFVLVDRLVSPFTLSLSLIYFILSLVFQLWIPAAILFVWWFFSRGLRTMPNWMRRQRNIRFVPSYVFANFSMAIIKIYALLTLNRQDWITRRGADRAPQPSNFRLTLAKIGTLAILVGLAMAVAYYRGHITG